MCPQSLLVEKLRELRHRFKGETRSCMVYKQQGGTNRVMVPKNKALKETTVRSILSQAGVTPAEIDAFIESCSEEKS